MIFQRTTSYVDDCAEDVDGDVDEKAQLVEHYGQSNQQHDHGNEDSQHQLSMEMTDVNFDGSGNSSSTSSRNHLQGGNLLYSDHEGPPLAPQLYGNSATTSSSTSADDPHLLASSNTIEGEGEDDNLEDVRRASEKGILLVDLHHSGSLSSSSKNRSTTSRPSAVIEIDARVMARQPRHHGSEYNVGLSSEIRSLDDHGHHGMISSTSTTSITSQTSPTRRSKPSSFSLSPMSSPSSSTSRSFQHQQQLLLPSASVFLRSLNRNFWIFVAVFALVEMQAVFSGQFLVLALRRLLPSQYNWLAVPVFGFIGSVAGGLRFVFTWVASRVGVYRIVSLTFALKLICIFLGYAFYNLFFAAGTSSSSTTISSTASTQSSSSSSDYTTFPPPGEESSPHIIFVLILPLVVLLVLHEACVLLEMGYSNILLNNLIDEYEHDHDLHVSPPTGYFFSAFAGFVKPFNSLGPILGSNWLEGNVNSRTLVVLFGGVACFQFLCWKRYTLEGVRLRTIHDELKSKDKNYNFYKHHQVGDHHVVHDDVVHHLHAARTRTSDTTLPTSYNDIEQGSGGVLERQALE
ncbi:unnamed protein product [Amoebophrya sp. A25]|nr:unnamed protein product [Amoebophrya sp. A25]|eukprot:GSA25T00022951001.1